jgi:hypothetical protein
VVGTTRADRSDPGAERERDQDADQEQASGREQDLTAGALHDRLDHGVEIDHDLRLAEVQLLERDARRGDELAASGLRRVLLLAG